MWPDTGPRLTTGVYTDEKLLPLAAELLNVPAIPTNQTAASPAISVPADADVQSIVAGLTASQKQSLLQMLTRSLAS